MGLINYDPSPEAVFNRIVPKFIMSLIDCAVVESFASEQGARRTAMESATDNADQMISNLSLVYNRARHSRSSALRRNIRYAFMSYTEDSKTLKGKATNG